MSNVPREGLDAPILLEFTTRIVSAYAGNATLSPIQLTELIAVVSRALSDIGNAPPASVAVALTPAVPIKKSVSPDFITCLEDGKKLKMLKRHLMSTYGMTPAEYRTKWGLPRDYPMVAPNYAATRSKLAIEIGLGRTPARPEPAVVAKTVTTRGRPRKVDGLDGTPALAEPAVLAEVAPKRGRPRKVAAA